MPQSENLTVAFVSGKGGVGKTMLAVAFAHEISSRDRTLLLDLDFFNRGLTGLMRHGSTVCPVGQPEFLKAPNSGVVSDGWELIEVCHNLLHLRYPDLTPEQIRAFENTSASSLAESLKKYLDYLREISGCSIIVIDCHGGPDQLSFAACIAADHSLLISEPDKITFYGTLHFLRQMERAVPAGTARPDVRLIFNKVVPAFSVPFLTRFYDKEVRSYFNQQPLLAVFPIEIYLTKEFERTPFLTAVYPYSQLAKKMRLVIRDLLASGQLGLVPTSILATSGLRQWLTRHWLGRTPAILNVNSVLVAVAIGALTLTVVGRYMDVFVASDYFTITVSVQRLTDPYWQGDNFLETVETVLNEDALRSSSDENIKAHYDQLRTAVNRHSRIVWLFYKWMDKGVTYVAAIGVFWFLAALILNWSMSLDRLFTYSSRGKHGAIAILFLLIVLALWFFPLLAVGAAGSDTGDFLSKALFAGLLVPLAFVFSDQGFKAYRNLRFDKNTFEGGARLLFLAYSAVLPFTASFFLSK
jgi:cellulose biosynthesis protein BcsQ